MDSFRIVSTEFGPITYLLEKKQVKNLNLRVNGQGEVLLSIPRRCDEELADDMIRRKSKWLMEVLNRRTTTGVLLLPELDSEASYRCLVQAVERVYPLVESMGVQFPDIRMRTMKSQWGNCHWSKGYITLNRVLSRCPQFLRDYVALHELVHFLHHDHGKGFYRAMDLLMPDWKQRRKLLRLYGGVLGS